MFRIKAPPVHRPTSNPSRRRTLTLANPHPRIKATRPSIHVYDVEPTADGNADASGGDRDQPGGAGGAASGAEHKLGANKDLDLDLDLDELSAANNVPLPTPYATACMPTEVRERESAR